MISRSPRSSLRYLILDFIDLFALSPIAGTDDSDHLVSIGEPDRQDAATDNAMLFFVGTPFKARLCAGESVGSPEALSHINVWP